jgi:hypothetical protein
MAAYRCDASSSEMSQGQWLMRRYSGGQRTFACKAETEAIVLIYWCVAPFGRGEDPCHPTWYQWMLKLM